MPYRHVGTRKKILSGHIALKFCSVKYANFLVPKPKNGLEANSC